jgi:uncharacterized protein (DUF924 family)
MNEPRSAASSRSAARPAEGATSPWQAVIDFWFGAPPTESPREQWFRKSEAFDAAIRERFGDLIEQALAGGLREWDRDASGAVARIVLLDQFTRNAFRDTARAFAGDALALEAARAMVAGGRDRALPGVMRQFVYLPFEHAEDRETQRDSVRLFAALAADHPALADVHAWAVRHRDVIARFGRYPHRNALLGRPSTPEEIEFLRQPGSSF